MKICTHTVYIYIYIYIYIYTVKSGILAHALISVNGKGLCAYRADMRL